MGRGYVICFGQALSIRINTVYRALKSGSIGGLILLDTVQPALKQVLESSGESQHSVNKTQIIQVLLNAQ